MLIVAPASVLIFHLPLPLATIGLLRLHPILHSWRSLLLRLLHSRCLLLGRRYTLDILLLRASHRSLFLLFPLSRCGRFLCLLRLEVLANYRVMRLITIILAANRLLLLHLPWIPVS